MEKYDTIRDVERFMDSIPKFSQKGSKAANFDLGRITRFCNEIGSPMNNFASIHVAGTNGKGTTCQMLASVYQTAGYKTALYTSPHLINVRERFRINGEMIEEPALLSFFRLFGEKVKEYELTYFELTTAVAFWYFSESAAEIAIIETGLGGRLDATNILTPVASVITSVGMDHTDLLGDSIEKIAAEKAGIIKPGIPVIIGRLPEKAKTVIVETARNHKSDLYSAEVCEPEFENDNIVLKTEGDILNLDATGRKKIDAVNAAVGFMVIQTLQARFPVSSMDFIKGIESTDQHFPHHAHFEKLLPQNEWYFDGAHNLESMTVLKEELKRRAPEHEWVVVLSFMKDKLNNDLAGIWNKFPILRLYEMEGDRAASFGEMKEIFPHATKVDDNEMFQWINSGRLKSELVIFSGSFYFYEKVRRWMGTIAADYV